MGPPFLGGPCALLETLFPGRMEEIERYPLWFDSRPIADDLHPDLAGAPLIEIVKTALVEWLQEGRDFMEGNGHDPFPDWALSWAKQSEDLGPYFKPGDSTPKS